ARTVELQSPDQRNVITLSVEGGAAAYTVLRDGRQVIAKSPLGILLQRGNPSGTAIGAEGLMLVDAQTRSGVESFVRPVGKLTQVNEAFREAILTLSASSGQVRRLKIVARAFDDGVAFRYVIPKQPGVGSLSIIDEQTAFIFPRDYDCWGLNIGRLDSSFEGEHDPIRASLIRPSHSYQAPLVCKTGSASFAISESDVENYPGAFYRGLGSGEIGVRVNLSPRKDNPPGARQSLSAARIDASNGFRTPWRLIMLGDKEGELIESHLVDVLAAPSRIGEAGWIKPGLSAWDWWNGNSFALPPEYRSSGPNAGTNTATYKHYIDFAAELGLDYVLIDEGWSVGSSIEPNAQADVTRAKSEVDIAELIRHARSKGVGIWLWLQWQQLDRQLDEALATYARWGVKGIKVDFMDRNDQQMVDYYHRLLSAAARNRLMVNLHGAFPPNGLARTYPNYVTQEGVLGAEYNKWSRRVTARHNVNLAFTRGLLGPMDYTPGGFRHSTPAEFPSKQRFHEPYVMTTRGAALAMYLVYASPVQMVSDTPAAYRTPDGGWQPGVDFIRTVPASWNETRFVSGALDDHVVIARRSGDSWYIGGMTDRARKVTIKLDFLGTGRWSATRWQDGDTISTLDVDRTTVSSTSRLSLDMADNGGGVIVLRPAGSSN
ncbi:MAG TPA: glycoside hydrolase family 97 protein, partial [Sphingomicrobium sp.]|nr:glycoside hydrolase family 97 protein [Sphingomicrobium sp.]